jgi:hypothetical protein
MNKTKAMALSIGAAIASAKVAYALTTFEFDDLLRPLGVARRHREWPSKLAFLGAGIVIGGVGALLFAPASGSSTREKIAQQAEKLDQTASNRARNLGEEPSGRVNATRPGLGVDQTPSG